MMHPSPTHFVNQDPRGGKAMSADSYSQKHYYTLQQFNEHQMTQQQLLNEQKKQLSALRNKQRVLEQELQNYLRSGLEGQQRQQDAYRQQLIKLQSQVQAEMNNQGYSSNMNEAQPGGPADAYAPYAGIGQNGAQNAAQIQQAADERAATMAREAAQAAQAALVAARKANSHIVNEAAANALAYKDGASQKEEQRDTLPKKHTEKQGEPEKHSTKPKKTVLYDIGNQYKAHQIIGEGAYGVVCWATHLPTSKRVAIKKISPFDHSLFALRTLRELKLLRYFAENRASENIISILDIIQPKSPESFKDIYIVQELMDSDLHRITRTQNLSDDHRQYFVWQTLRAVKALHALDVVHRDLKPSNLLLNSNCDLKVCDFGLARSVSGNDANQGDGVMTKYVATRWYRAPEIMLSFKNYSKAIDIWSVGCILAEMLGCKPLFPGRDYVGQITCVLNVIGTPEDTELRKFSTKRSRAFLRTLPRYKKQSFKTLFPDASPSAIDFLERSLCFNPEKRMTVEEALAHPYLQLYHDPDDEPVPPKLPHNFFAFEKDPELTDYKSLLLDEVRQYAGHRRF